MLDGVMGSLGVFGVIHQARANRDFLGRPIVSQSMENLESKDQFNRNTSKAAYYAGKYFGFSPIMVDYFGNQVLGYLWKVPRALFPVGDENRDWTLGVKNTYVKDNVYSQDLVNWLYDQKDKTESAKASDSENIDKQISFLMDNRMTLFYSRFNALNKNNETTTSKREARQTVLTMIYEYRKALDSGIESEGQKLAFDVVRKSEDTELLPSPMQTYIKSDDVRYDLSDAQYVEYQTLYLKNYWEYAASYLPGAKTDREKRAVLRQAKELAKERAADRILKQYFNTGNSALDDYEGVSNRDIINFNVNRDQDGNGSTTQEEAIAVLQTMVENGLSFEDAYMLYHSVHKGWTDKNNPWAAYKP